MRNIFLTIFAIFFGTYSSFAGDLNMQAGKIYLLNLDEEIQNMHTDSNFVDAQILHSIFNDKKQVILSLKNSQNGFLQIKTESGLENYNLKNADTVSKELIEIDIPPFENLDVDVYAGE